MARGLGIGLGVALVAATALAAVAAAGAGCGSNGGGFAGDSGTSSGGDGAASGPDGGMLFGDSGPTTGSITIAPQNPVVDVTISNGAITAMPITFTAMSGASPVSVNWSLDRGELGTLGATNGVFTASGNIGGKGNVTATYGMATATTMVTVRLHVTENGAPSGGDAGAQDGGAGGIGGVGGSPLGGPLPQGVVMALQGMATPPANPQELGWLYPYDRTVWPRGILAPLLQWQTTHNVTGVFIHLTENNFDFQGFYGGANLVNQPIDAAPWTQATYGNGGDKLHVELTIYDGTTKAVVGPTSEDWTIAPGTLKGTVYYNSYNSYLVGNQGAVLAVNPGATAPNVAVASTASSCHVCHELAADGQTLFIQDMTYSDGASYDMKNMGAVLASYNGIAADGTSNNRKFLWSGVYPDGTFAMANANHAREHYSGSSLLFKRSDGTQIATNGWTNLITSAVTPAFSPDGSKLAFNFWDGPGSSGVPAGNGHTLNVMDFACGAADGGVTCGAPPYTLSNLRVLYNDSARYPGWPAFMPDGSALVFHNTVTAGSCSDCEIATWNGSQAELWYTKVPAAGAGNPAPMRLDALNGLTGGQSYLPTNANHPNDTVLNYEPTANPIPSGGYFWVVFTSRRMYGNVAAGDPYDNGNGAYPIPKKLWVAAVDMQPMAGQEPSHPAFYLPGQELNAGNMRGFWVVEPCKANGQSCLTGDECCNGFCEQSSEGGGLVCGSQSMGCSQEFEHCNTDSDCCGAAQGFRCINHFCSQPAK